MNQSISDAVSRRLADAQKIVIASHVRPDGDAIGSALGLGLALMQAGKSVEVILADGVPSSFKFLAGSELAKKEPSGACDTFITVDCADFKRTGKVFENFGQPDINIDHHKTNENFGKLNLVEAEEVATAAILTKYLPQWGLEISQPVAAALLTGILTDTLGFRTSNVAPAALRQAAALMERGANLPEIYMQSLVRKSFPAAKYWGAGLSKLESKGGIVWGTLTLADRKAAGYGGNDDADLINLISAIEGNKVGMIFVEQTNARVKISWRALQADVDVSQVAKHFQGGGHAAAAGADIDGNLADVQKEVLQVTRNLLNL